MDRVKEWLEINPSLRDSDEKLTSNIWFDDLKNKGLQSNAGGMTDAYLDGGTYVKSFYTLLNRPDCTKINIMGRSQRRLHHLINWNAAVPCIIPEQYKK